jgi:hypothetical protein
MSDKADQAIAYDGIEADTSKKRKAI